MANDWNRFRKLENAIIEETGGYRESWLWAHALVGMWPTYVRRRNEFIIDRLLGFVGALSDIVVALLDVPAGYLRVFAHPRDFGKPPRLVGFRHLVNSDELTQWENDTVRLLMKLTSTTMRPAQPRPPAGRA